LIHYKCIIGIVKKQALFPEFGSHIIQVGTHLRYCLFAYIFSHADNICFVNGAGNIIQCDFEKAGVFCWLVTYIGSGAAVISNGICIGVLIAVGYDLGKGFHFPLFFDFLKGRFYLVQFLCYLPAWIVFPLVYFKAPYSDCGNSHKRETDNDRDKCSLFHIMKLGQHQMVLSQELFYFFSSQIVCSLQSSIFIKDRNHSLQIQKINHIDNKLGNTQQANHHGRNSHGIQFLHNKDHRRYD